MGTPELNPEIKTALRKHPKTLKRDTFQIKNETQLSAALGALGSTLTIILNSERNNDSKELFETISDVGKIQINKINKEG